MNRTGRVAMGGGKFNNPIIFRNYLFKNKRSSFTLDLANCLSKSHICQKSNGDRNKWAVMPNHGASAHIKLILSPFN